MSVSGGFLTARRLTSPGISIEVVDGSDTFSSHFAAALSLDWPWSTWCWIHSASLSHLTPPRSSIPMVWVSVVTNWCSLAVRWARPLTPGAPGWSRAGSITRHPLTLAFQASGSSCCSVAKFCLETGSLLAALVIARAALRQAGHCGLAFALLRYSWCKGRGGPQSKRQRAYTTR